jgi:hypothetical protein
MRNFLESLSLGSGAGLVMLVSALLAAVSARFPSRIVAWLLALAVPYIVSYSLYWSPFWLGADSLEAGAWAGFFIVPWYIAGLVVSLGVVYLVRLCWS